MDDILDQKPGSYYMDVREFQDGTIEVVLKAIRPMQEGAILSTADPLSYSNCCKEMGESPSVSDKPRIAQDKEQSSFEQQDNHSRCVRRAKQNIRWLVKGINADRLLTLTYRKNQENREEVKEDFKRFLRLIRKGWAGQTGSKAWQYVAVLERQERGAYHIHCAVKGWQRISFLRAAWYKALGGQGNESGENTPGNIDVTSPKKARWGTQRRDWKSGKLAAYLTKYLAKTFDEETTEKRRYWHSKDALLPQKTRFILCSNDFISAIKELMSIVYLHYGLALDFSRSWVAKSEDCLWLSLGEGT
jgi:hypothetical protein